VIADILSRLEKVKPTGKGTWLACCPAHEDRSPSFTLRECDDGRILAHCFSGCDIESIVGAVGLGWDAWFPPKPIEHAEPVRRAFPAADVLEALAFEATVLEVASGATARGENLSDEDRARVRLAGERIREGRRYAIGG